jgi:acetyl-CoA carboxylase biotin carboxyl carrier protein
LAKKKPATPAAQKSIPGSPMDLAMLEQVVTLMAANKLTYIEVRDGDKRVVLRSGAAPESAGFAPTYTVATHQPSPQSAPAATTPAAAPADADAGLVPIKSPMVGTFYSSSGPDAKPFVAVGSTVDEESDVCIIEAMKVFNNIKAETKGTIAKIVVTNGQTVEFGQVLFLVKP